ncbi:uncharacterized protein si:zfos-911d5.4 [Gadus chalcogrammus]|uniref:uncharacterized protein si:zfos-911d5.4 n=1 Tax=Gadus chalcogrammus TaxID=1042646 RepID=UPI0024C4AE01|nr:uncharacterized protein si:zfos-911d5.4 [Gadus chalcogrammus]
MLHLGTRLALFSLGSGEPENTKGQSLKPSQTPQDFPKYVRKLTGLKSEHVFCNLRVPNQLQTANDDINIVLLTGRGVFCLDLKPWRGAVSAHQRGWHVQLRQEGGDLPNTCVEQVDDPVQAITTKTVNLCHHLKRSGVCVRQSLFIPRVVFLSPDCDLDQELRKRKELVSYDQLDPFLASFRESYVGWLSDALTPSWISGRQSYRQLEAVRGLLGRAGTWDLLQLRGGEQIRGDYQGCPYVALDRRETGTLEFSGAKTLSPDSLWALLGHAPRVTVRMYKRGARGWLGKTQSASATIPSDTLVLFRRSGEETEAKIPAGTIHSIILSI